MEADSAVNIGRLCFVGMKEVVRLDRSPLAQLFLLVTAYLNELVRIKTFFEMKCDKNIEKWWHSFWTITALLESVAMAKWDGRKGISEKAWLTAHKMQSKFITGLN